MFATRLAINGQTIEQKEACKVLGVWISQDAGDWERNTKKICKSAYSRVSMLTKLKYVGVKIQDLLEIYCLFIRSRAEYCAVAFHSSLTQEQSRKIENIQRTSLKIILQEDLYRLCLSLLHCRPSPIIFEEGIQVPFLFQALFED